ncbi:MAG: hypothetical protein ACR2OI_01370 [Acidimicrobiia bacterium]
MPDFVKKIKKSNADQLQEGEELLAATIGQPSGTFSRQALGGIVGVMAGKKSADKKMASLDGADGSGLAASIPPNQQLVIGLTDRRMLFFSLAPMSGNPKDLVASTDLSQVFEMTLEKHKMTSSLVIRFADNSARMFECVKMSKPADTVEAFNKLNQSRAA